MSPFLAVFQVLLALIAGGLIGLVAFLVGRFLFRIVDLATDDLLTREPKAP